MLVLTDVDVQLFSKAEKVFEDYIMSKGSTGKDNQNSVRTFSKDK